jgi:hypothetical protein
MMSAQPNAPIIVNSEAHPGTPIQTIAIARNFYYIHSQFQRLITNHTEPGKAR